MKTHAQNISNKAKRGEQNFQSKKRGSFSMNEGFNDNKKKVNISPQKANELKKEMNKHDKNNIPNSQQSSDNKDSNHKPSNNNTIKISNNAQTNNYINNINNKKNEDIKDKQDRQDKKKIDNIQPSSRDNNINNNVINLNENKDSNKKTNKINTINIKINEKNKDDKKDIKETSIISHSLTAPSAQISDENFYNQLKENDKKLKDTLQAYNNMNKKSEGASLNTLFKLRSILINWLKDSDQDLEYTKFMTEKKLKYLMKNKEKSEARIKVLDSEIKAINVRKEELEKILGEIYIYYDEEGLKEDIKRFENSNEVKSGKFSKTLE